MLPKVIVYNSVSADGSIKDFDVDIGLHYEVLGKLGVDALLAGSNTAKSGIEMFMQTVPPEEIGDFDKPEVKPQDKRPFWVIPDSRGILQGLLHVHRRSGYTKGIIVLVSNSTPKSYLDYLAERHYDVIVSGDNHVNYRSALEILASNYGVKTVVTDTGGMLAAILLESGLVDEVHLLLAPEIVGKKAVNLFRTLTQKVKIEFATAQPLRGSHILLRYRVKKQVQRSR